MIDFVDKFDKQKSYAGDVTVRFLSSRVPFHCLDTRHVPLVIILFLSYQFPTITNTSNSMTHGPGNEGCHREKHNCVQGFFSML